MFETLIKVKLANPSPKGGALAEHIDFLKQKIQEMNGIKSNHNQKVVSVLRVIDKDTILLKVVSELELGVPGRAFTGLSRSLIDESSTNFDDFYQKNVFHSRLLSFEKFYEDSEEAEKMTDTDLILRTVILANKSKSLLTKTEKEILTQLKMLASYLPNSIS